MGKNEKKLKDKKIADGIILIVLVALVVVMSMFASTRESSNQEIILMEIYKSAGTETSKNYYYIYDNTNTVEIRSFTPDGSSTTISKEITQDSIDAFKNALDEYITENPTVNTSFYMNERYTIEFNGMSIIVPSPSVSSLLGYDSTPYTFYNTVDEFINSINN